VFWLAGAPADCTVFGLVAPWLGPAERSSPAAAQRCAVGAGLDGAGQGRASLPPSRTTTRSDTVWLLKSRFLHIRHRGVLHQFLGGSTHRSVADARDVASDPVHYHSSTYRSTGREASQKVSRSQAGVAWIWATLWVVQINPTFPRCARHIVTGSMESDKRINKVAVVEGVSNGSPNG